VVEAEDRFAMACAMRIAFRGSEADMRALRPGARSNSPDIEYDETGLAEELASFGFIEVPADGK